MTVLNATLDEFATFPAFTLNLDELGIWQINRRMSPILRETGTPQRFQLLVRFLEECNA